MNLLRRTLVLFAASLLATSAFAADPTGAWKWTLSTPNGDIETTLTLTFKDGKLAGTYSNSFGDAAISNASFKDDVLSFTVDRELGGNKFTLKLQGKIDGDTVKGTIDLPAMNGADGRKVDWNAKRVAATPAKEKTSAAKT